MEILGIYDPEELSLFGGDQLLMGLGSPEEPDSPELFPDDRGGNKVLELLGQGLPSSKDVTHSSIGSYLHSYQGHEENPLDASWLDTTLDLDLLEFTDVDSTTNRPEQSFFVPEAVNVEQQVPRIASHKLSAEELLNQMCNAPHLLTQAGAEVETDGGNEVLAEVLNKLTSYLEDNNADSIPELSLSPVSIDDVESLLSDPVSPEPTSSMDNTLDTLFSSEPSSPGDPDYCPPYQYTSSEAGPMRSGKSKSQRKSRTPIDKKERKKVQNKTAALRYRQKKKSEADIAREQMESLEDRNVELKEQVDSMTREIQYLKDLMAEVQRKKMNN